MNEGETKTEAYWELRLICCGREDGTLTFASWVDADAAREVYTSGAGVDPYGYSGPRAGSWGHQRAAILSRVELTGDDCDWLLGVGRYAQ